MLEEITEGKVEEMEVERLTRVRENRSRTGLELIQRKWEIIREF